MITVFVKNCNLITQAFYDAIVGSLQIHRITCSCGHSSCLPVHAYYTRFVKQDGVKTPLRIRRLRCSECGRTHAILLSALVPYSQIAFKDQHQICINYEEGICSSAVCDTNPSIDENNVKSVIRNYRKRWREMLRSLSISLDPADELIRLCFSKYSAQFMQIRRGYNALFSIST